MKLALASFLILIAFGFPLLAHPLQPATRRTLVFTQVNIIGCCRLPKLALLVEAGLTPLQALQSATFNAARFFQQSRDWGTIEQGKVADLVLLDANPLRDIRNTQKINTVVINERLLDRRTLNGLLSKIEAAARANQ